MCEGTVAWRMRDAHQHVLKRQLFHAESLSLVPSKEVGTASVLWIDSFQKLGNR